MKIQAPLLYFAPEIQYVGYSMDEHYVSIAKSLQAKENTAVQTL